MQTRLSVVELSRGSIWNPDASEPPYLGADPGSPWPGDAAYTVFYDTSGGEITTLDGDVTPEQVSFTADADEVDIIPAGANFETFLDTDDGPQMIRYGKVVRREATFPDAPAIVRSAVALNFTDTFPTLGLRSSWKAIAGRTKVYDNSGASLPNGVSANGEFLFARSAIRWEVPLNSDTVKSHVLLLNQGPGKLRIIVCADQRLTSYLAVEFDSGLNKLNMCIGSGPNTVTYQGTEISHTVVDLSDYTLTYDDVTKTLAVYQGTDTAPLKTFVDTLGVVPHGNGYRYAGFSFDTGLFFSPGIEMASWQAKDN